MRILRDNQQNPHGMVKGVIMSDARTRLVEKLDVECERSVAFFRELTQEQLNRVVYTDGAHWTPRQVLAHFSASETSMGKLIDNILGGGAGTPEDFDLNRYNERKASELEAESLEGLIERFMAARQATIEKVNRLNDDDLQKKGRHPFLGVAPVEDIVQLMYRHNQIHQREIRKALAGE
jgi:hypothetical protein